jgi:RNA polymerase sigma-70 factor (ECF subfamily)
MATIHAAAAPSGVRPAAPSDEEIVARVVAGERELFELLMRRHNRRVYRAVRAILRDEAETEDVMQTAYLSALSHLAGFQGGAAFATWITRIAVNEALNRLRRRSGLVLVEEEPEGGEGSGDVRTDADPERRTAARELVGIVERAIDHLPMSYRTILMLRDVEGLSTADAAASLGIGEPLAKVRLLRARRALRGEIDAMLGEDAQGAFAFDAVRCDRVVRGVLERM